MKALVGAGILLGGTAGLLWWLGLILLPAMGLTVPGYWRWLLSTIPLFLLWFLWKAWGKSFDNRERKNTEARETEEVGQE